MSLISRIGEIKLASIDKEDFLRNNKDTITGLTFQEFIEWQKVKQLMEINESLKQIAEHGIITS